MVFTKASGAVLLLAALVGSAQGHGQMTSPRPRQVTAKYRSDCYGGLKGAGNDELQWAPVENLIQRKQADQPYAATFDIMNGCRGMVYESGGPVTELTAGREFTVEYYIQAPHPGYMELAIVKPKTDADGKVMYERDLVIKKVENFATNSDGKSTTATIPATVSGCNKAGDCALQFYWHSDIANQTYPTCADIIVKGGAASSSSGGGGGASATGSTGSSAVGNATTTLTRAPTSSSGSRPSSSRPTSASPARANTACARRNRLRV